jgi:hypothetical protein
MLAGGLLVTVAVNTDAFALEGKDKTTHISEE